MLNRRPSRPSNCTTVVPSESRPCWAWSTSSLEDPVTTVAHPVPVLWRSLTWPLPARWPENQPPPLAARVWVTTRAPGGGVKLSSAAGGVPRCNTPVKPSWSAAATWPWA